MITWQADRPPSCDDHGPLTSRPLPGPAGAIVMLEHLRDAHGKQVDGALAKLTARPAGGAHP